MRARLILIVLIIVAVAGFAAQNWSEFNRSVPLTFGVLMSEAPLGLILLSLLAITLVAFLISSAAQESRHMTEYRRQARALEMQRELAEKAEASRFTDLRQHLDTHLREARQHDAITATEFEKSMVQSQRELRAQLEQLNHTLASRLDQLAARMAGGPDGIVEANPRTVDIPVRERL